MNLQLLGFVLNIKVYVRRTLKFVRYKVNFSSNTIQRAEKLILVNFEY